MARTAKRGHAIRTRTAVQEALAQVHERWDGKGIPAGVAGEKLKVAARVGCLCHDVTVHRIDSNRLDVRKMIRRRAGGQHDPQVAEAFLKRSDDLLDAVEIDSVWDAVLAAEPEPRPWLSPSRIDDTARAFADFTNLKSVRRAREFVRPRSQLPA